MSTDDYENLKRYVSITGFILGVYALYTFPKVRIYFWDCR